MFKKVNGVKYLWEEGVLFCLIKKSISDGFAALVFEDAHRARICVRACVVSACVVLRNSRKKLSTTIPRSYSIHFILQVVLIFFSNQISLSLTKFIKKYSSIFNIKPAYYQYIQD